MAKRTERSLKERIAHLRAQLEAICATKGHDIEQKSRQERIFSGSHVEGYETTDCDHCHRCACPVEVRYRSVNDYQTWVITERRCRRCDIFEPTTKRRIWP